VEPSPKFGPNSETEVSHLVAHLFRNEAGKMVSSLIHTLGLENLELAEDAVQDALLKAMRNWPFAGIPQNPSAWLMHVARNYALDVVRRAWNFHTKENEIALLLESQAGRGPRFDQTYFDDEIRDNQLRMMFACCHPVLLQETQVALTLKTLCGFGEQEIAATFLISNAAVAKRLVRARRAIREAAIALEIPAGEELSQRFDAVLQTLYLLFNEGYKASHGDELVRKELCQEAIRLITLLVLLALMLFNAARLSSRADTAGNILLLAQQDRSLWDKTMIGRGLFHLNLSAAGEEISEFHLQAGIASCHCTARSYEGTDWTRILCLYDLLIKINRSPVIALNRAVAISHVHGPAAASAAIEAIPEKRLLENYYLFHAIAAQIHLELNDLEFATREFQRARELTGSNSERAFLEKRLKECKARLAA
jgi:RNA polymerase sigma-70 factor (ECF subfamily)